MLQLMNILQTKGYICGNHEEDFVIGKSYLYNLETCIKSAVVIVPWISKEFLRSPYCMKDLDMACHFYDKGIMVMPLLYNLQFQHIPDILQQMVCLDVSGDVSFWTDRFLESLSTHVRSTFSVISPLQEVNGLVEQFDRMSVQAKIIFALKFNAENMFDMPRLMNDISQEELLNIFEIQLIEKSDCFHVVENYNFSSGVKESECEICILLSFNTSTISLCDCTVISLLSRVCATQLQSIAPRNKGYKKVCAVLEYILKKSVAISGLDGSVLHLCYENNYFMDHRRMCMLMTNNIRVYDNAGKYIRSSCLDLAYA